MVESNATGAASAVPIAVRSSVSVYTTPSSALSWATQLMSSSARYFSCASDDAFLSRSSRIAQRSSTESTFGPAGGAEVFFLAGVLDGIAPGWGPRSGLYYGKHWSLWGALRTLFR